jgi:hypothetical protein
MARTTMIGDARAPHDAGGLRDEARAAGLGRVVWIGMGGAGSAARLVAHALVPGADALPITVLDTIEPHAILAALGEGGEDALVVVASTTGATPETIALGRLFHERARAERGERAGERFVAITAPGTPLEALARRSAFRRVVHAEAPVSERLAALGPLGATAAELAHVGLAALEAEAAHDEAEARGVALGARLAELARAGRDKLTVIAPPTLAALGEHAAALFAAVTGKGGRGLVPVVGEPLATPAAYGQDRVFLALGPAEPALAAIAVAHPVLRVPIARDADVVSAVRRLEIGALRVAEELGVDPSDGAAVREVEDVASDLVARARAGGAPATPEPTLRQGGVSVLSVAPTPSLRALVAHAIRTARAGDYLALHAYLPQTPPVLGALEEALAALRALSPMAVSLDFGPRVLHGAASLHRDGPPGAMIVQLTADPAREVDIPGEPLGFGALARAEALADLAAHWRLGRRAVRLHLGRDPAAGLRALADAARATQGGLPTAA